MSAYVVMIRERVTDAAELKAYQQLAPAARAGHAITPLAFYGNVDVLEGDPVAGVVIHQFPSVEAARAWYDSPAYQAALEHRLRGAVYRVLIVEGVAPVAAA
jgi:uncharacterized protein (DUF1330 family)